MCSSDLVAVVGVGYSDIERRSQRTVGALTRDALNAAMADAGITAKDVDGLATYPEIPVFGNPQQADVPVMFFSRRIGLVDGKQVPIDVGGRITGKSGPYSIGLIDIRTSAVSERNLAATNFGVVRVKRDILRRSAVGVLYTDRSSTLLGPGHASTVGVDGVFSFFQNLNFNTYLAASDNPNVSDHNLSYRAQMDYAGDRYGAQLERLTLDTNFNPEVGFVRRPDMRKSFALARFSPRSRRYKSDRKSTRLNSSH